MKLLTTALPVIIVLMSTGAGYFVVRLHRYRTNNRRNPLTHNLLRGPGETLRGQIDDVSFELNYYFLMFIALPLYCYSSYLALFGPVLAGTPTISIYLFTLMFLASLVYVAYKTNALMTLRQSLRLGFECEVAVGQELNQLMLDGYRIYHDFFGDKFNIDHIVVGRNGVFAIETKGRAKRNGKGDTSAATVVYDGHTLRFPGWSETKPLDQARRNALWLEKWLSKAVGESISVMPILAIPGWFVKREKNSDVPVYNGSYPQFIMKLESGKLSQSMIQRVAYQLEQKCRTVEPASYKHNNKA